MVSAIIPAYNEEKTVGRVVRSVKGHSLISEVIVVDDGSRDQTSMAARAAGARVIRLPQNSGKAAALHAGVTHARNHAILFVDADMSGFTHAVLTQIIEPVAHGECEMCVGVRVRQSPLMNMLSRLMLISGQRALTKRVWSMVPESSRVGFRIELALNYCARQTERGLMTVPIHGVGQVIKEKKYGFFNGLKSHMKMIADLVLVIADLYIVENFIRSFYTSAYKQQV